MEFVVYQRALKRSWACGKIIQQKLDDRSTTAPLTKLTPFYRGNKPLEILAGLLAE